MTEPFPGGEEPPPLKFHYRNHEGNLATRRVKPIRIWHGKSPWHKGRQWFLRGYDLDRDAERDYALEDVAFGDPKRTPRFNPNLRRGFLPIALGLIILVLLLIGGLTLMKSYFPTASHIESTK